MCVCVVWVRDGYLSVTISTDSIKKETQRSLKKKKDLFFFLFRMWYLSLVDSSWKIRRAKSMSNQQMRGREESEFHLAQDILLSQYFRSSHWCQLHDISLFATVEVIFVNLSTLILWPFQLHTSNLYSMSLLPLSPGRPSGIKFDTRPTAPNASHAAYVK